MYHETYMRLALHLAERGYGATSPNPMVGAVIVRNREVIGRGWHHRAGEPHAEIEALRDAQRRGKKVKGATIYVTLEPCSSHGRTPPCTEAILAAGLRRVFVGATDPNPLHRGKAFPLLRRAGLEVKTGLLQDDCDRLNEVFNQWVVHRTPFVTVKAAMTLDGKIATASGESKWITGERSRAYAMRLRQGADAILGGINTVLLDDPGLTFRPASPRVPPHRLQRVILDSAARTPLTARVIREDPQLTTIVVSETAPAKRVERLAKIVRVLIAPGSKRHGRVSLPSPANRGVDLRWLLRKLGAEGVTSLLVEGGGEVNASFLLGGFAHRIAFFYAPKILGGRDARRAVAGDGAQSLADSLELADLEWRRLPPDWLLTARVLRRGI